MRTLIVLFASTLAIAATVAAQNEPLRASGRRDSMEGLRDRVVLEFKVTTNMTLGARGDLEGVAVCYPGTRNRVWNTYFDPRGEGSISVLPGRYDVIVFGGYGKEAFMRSVDVTGFRAGDIIPINLRVDGWDAPVSRARASAPVIRSSSQVQGTRVPRSTDDDPEIAALRQRLQRESAEADRLNAEMRQRNQEELQQPERSREVLRSGTSYGRQAQPDTRVTRRVDDDSDIQDLRQRLQRESADADRLNAEMRQRNQEELRQPERSREVLRSGTSYGSQVQPGTRVTRRVDDDSDIQDLRQRLQRESAEADRLNSQMRQRNQQELQQPERSREVLRSGTSYGSQAQPDTRVTRRVDDDSDIQDLRQRLQRESAEADRLNADMRRRNEQELQPTRRGYEPVRTGTTYAPQPEQPAARIPENVSTGRVPTQPEPVRRAGASGSFSLRIFEAYRFSDGAVVKSGDNSADLHFYYFVRNGGLQVYLSGDRIKPFSGQPAASDFSPAAVRTWSDQVYGPAPGFYGLVTRNGRVLLLRLVSYENQGQGPGQWKMNFAWQEVN